MKVIILLCLFVLGISSCNFLELDPTDRITGDVLLESREGVKSILSNLYSEMAYDYPGVSKDEFLWTKSLNRPTVNWETCYKNIRKINTFIEQLKSIDHKIISSDEVNIILGECYFFRANQYFQLVRRFYGVPLITVPQEFNSNVESLRVPRATEEETWDFILKQCDDAIGLLPQEWDAANANRLTRWAALSLKCRVALYAASSAKFSTRLPLTGEAVDLGLVGMKPELAVNYYQQCIDAAEEIIDNGPFDLYGKNPASAQEAQENYRRIFYEPEKAMDEVIFKYMFHDTYKTHKFTMEHVSKNVFGIAQGWYQPTLALVDLYESMSSKGASAPIFTKQGMSLENDINNYNGFDPNAKYRSFKKGELRKLFEGKDPRMFATIVLPEENWIGQENVIQGGIVKPDGSVIWLSDGQVEWNGNIYYSYGGSDPSTYSGFGDPLSPHGHSQTGFWGKKYINTNLDPTEYEKGEGTPVVVFRYAEILLNYAEAVVESGLGDRGKAIQGLNDLRKRAFLPDDGKITEESFTVERVLRERNIELALEPILLYDYFRRKEGDKIFDGNFMRTALVPMVDLRNLDGSGEPTWIFIRTKQLDLIGQIFYRGYYFDQIWGMESNGLIPNPQL